MRRLFTEQAVTDIPAGRLVEIGIVGRPHGVRGELRVHLHNPGSEVIGRADPVYLLRNPGGEPVVRRIEGVRQGPRCVLVSLEGADSRELAAELKGARLLVPRSVLPPPEEDEFYVDDLPGVEVRVGAVRLGVVSGSREQGGVEVVTVDVDAGTGGDPEEIQIPLAEEFVERLCLDEGLLVVRDIDDLPRHPRRKGRG